MGRLPTSVWNIGRVARFLNAPVVTVRWWADHGKIPCTRSAKGTRYFLAQDVIDFENERKSKLRV